MRLYAIPREGVFMAMVFVVHMPMDMFQRFMRVQVLMPFGQVQPDPDAHQHGRKGITAASASQAL